MSKNVVKLNLEIDLGVVNYLVNDLQDYLNHELEHTNEECVTKILQTTIKLLQGSYCETE